jgi:hypothetical protein
MATTWRRRAAPGGLSFPPPGLPSPLPVTASVHVVCNVAARILDRHAAAQPPTNLPATLPAELAQHRLDLDPAHLRPRLPGLGSLRQPCLGPSAAGRRTEVAAAAHRRHERSRHVHTRTTVLGRVDGRRHHRRAGRWTRHGPGRRRRQRARLRRSRHVHTRTFDLGRPSGCSDHLRAGGWTRRGPGRHHLQLDRLRRSRDVHTRTTDWRRAAGRRHHRRPRRSAGRRPSRHQLPGARVSRTQGERFTQVKFVRPFRNRNVGARPSRPAGRASSARSDQNPASGRLPRSGGRTAPVCAGRISGYRHCAGGPPGRPQYARGTASRLPARADVRTPLAAPHCEHMFVVRLATGGKASDGRTRNPTPPPKDPASSGAKRAPATGPARPVATPVAP